jgi:hypothetical protein
MTDAGEGSDVTPEDAPRTREEWIAHIEATKQRIEAQENEIAALRAGTALLQEGAAAMNRQTAVLNAKTKQVEQAAADVKRLTVDYVTARLRLEKLVEQSETERIILGEVSILAGCDAREEFATFPAAPSEDGDW